MFRLTDNQKLYEEWTLSGNKGDGGQVREDHPGPRQHPAHPRQQEESLVFGGNFIIEKQLWVAQIDSGAFLGAYKVQVSN